MRRALAIAAATAVTVGVPVATAARPTGPATRHAKAKSGRGSLSARMDARGRRFGLPPHPGAARPPAAVSAAPGAAPVATSDPGGLLGAVAGALTPAAPVAAALPWRTGVLLDEFRVTPARDPVAAGTVELDPVNYGEDPHDLTIARNGSVVAKTATIGPGDAAVLTVDLPAGDYRLYCSLFDGAHDAAGMHATLHVR